MKKIEKNILEILKQGEYENGVFYLPFNPLDRKIYLQVNEVLENAGGKWSRKDKGHIFQSDPKKLWNALESGENINEKKLYQFFETPEKVVKKIISLAEIKTGMTVLEPSAGHGAICDMLPKDIELTCIELDAEKCKVLMDKNYKVENIDFLNYKPSEKFDVIVMNPPFTKGQDASHILHAWDLLSEIGIVVSVMSASVKFNSQKKYQKIRKMVEESGYIIDLPDETFKESGTKVNTVIVVLSK